MAHLLSVDGEWRSVPVPVARSSIAALSPIGTKLLVWGYAEENPVTVHDLTTGESHSVAYPGGYRPWDFTHCAWIDEATMLLDDSAGGWRVDVANGEAIRTPYPSDMANYWAFDPDGKLVESAEWRTPRVLKDWAGDEARRVSMDQTGRLGALVVDASTVVGTSYDGHPFSLIVADRDTLNPRAVLPLRDPQGNYSPGALRVVALQDDGTVLFRVSVLGRDVDGFRVVAWRPDSGDLTLVSTTSLPAEQSVEFAEGLLRRTDP